MDGLDLARRIIPMTKRTFDLAPIKSHPPMHIAFVTDNREQVDLFYKVALQAGATDNGQPGLRPIYHANYYGTFVFDPDGHNIEAICHKAIANQTVIKSETDIFQNKLNRNLND